MVNVWWILLLYHFFYYFFYLTPCLAWGSHELEYIWVLFLFLSFCFYFLFPVFILFVFYLLFNFPPFWAGRVTRAVLLRCSNKYLLFSSLLSFNKYSIKFSTPYYEKFHLLNNIYIYIYLLKIRIQTEYDKYIYVIWRACYSCKILGSCFSKHHTILWQKFFFKISL